MNAHGSSTPLNDPTETLAMKHDVRRPRAEAAGEQHQGRTTATRSAPPVRSSWRSRALALDEKWLPPTLNLDAPRCGCDLDYIPKHGRDADVEYALSNSFGFGGINAAVVLKRHDGV